MYDRRNVEKSALGFFSQNSNNSNNNNNNLRFVVRQSYTNSGRKAIIFLLIGV